MDLSEHIARARVEGTIDGLALALIKNGEIIQRFSGHSDQEKRSLVTEQTVFPVASLSKPVFAYTVLKLVDQGVLSLDTPLKEVVDYAPGDEFAAEITAAHVLSHTTGFPNWRSSEQPLKSYFRPGDRFSYSGEGFVFLQRAVERLTGESLDATARRLVFEPLGMTRSTFDPTRAFDGTVAPPEPAADATRSVRATGNAARSLRTTAHDYAQFLKAVLSGAGLKSTTSESWMEARKLVPANFVNAAEPRGMHQTDSAVAWGLGWGLETESRFFFQWGANNGYVSFTIGSRVDGVAFVILTTGFTGLDCLRQLVDVVLPGPRPSLAWLGRMTPQQK
jgi:CubicO group peptidase (beta-lactamase class C family)